MRKIGLAAAIALSAASGAFAASNDLGSAVSNGTFGIEGVAYLEQTRTDEKTDPGNTKSHGFAELSVDAKYLSDSYQGIKFGVGGILAAAPYEQEEGDWGDGEDDSGGILHTLHLGYYSDLLDVVVGRQEINLDWASDYFTAGVLTLKPVDKLAITGAYVYNYTGDAYYDGSIHRFEKINDDDGAFVVNVNFDVADGLTINPYAFYINDIATWLGGKVNFDNDQFGLTAGFTVSDEDLNDEDGSVMWLEGRVAAGEATVKAGYVATDKDGGAGTIGGIGDNINPFEDGDQLLANVDGKTLYVGAEIEHGQLTVSALLGLFENKTASKNKQNELDVGLNFAINDQIALDGKFVYAFNGKEGYKDEDYASVRLAAIFSYGN